MSEGASMGDLIEGVERFVVDEVAKCNVQHNKFQKAVESRMKEIDNKLENVIAEQETINTSLEKIEQKVNEMNAHMQIAEKITDTQMSDFKQRMEDIDKDMAQVNPNVIRDLTGKVITIKNSFKSTFEALDDLDTPNETMDEDSQQPIIQTPPPLFSTPNLPSPPMSYIPKRTFYRNPSSERMRPETVNRLQQFISPINKSDKLTQMESAFFKMFMNEHEKEKLEDTLLHKCIHEGVENGVWAEDYVPEGVADFEAYLKERMRNHRKYGKRIALKRNQRKRLSEYLQQSVREAEEPMQDNSGQ